MRNETKLACEVRLEQDQTAVNARLVNHVGINNNMFPQMYVSSDKVLIHFFMSPSEASLIPTVLLQKIWSIKRSNYVFCVCMFH